MDQAVVGRKFIVGPPVARPTVFGAEVMVPIDPLALVVLLAPASDSNLPACPLISLMMFFEFRFIL
jgi:hypothetical protein